MSQNYDITKEIEWIKQPVYGEVVTKGQLLKDIKTNIKSLLNDYRGRGIENEAMLIAEVDKMFTGGVVPSLVDWKVLNMVLYELSEVKERGSMYRLFIQDVSDSLGVSDLIQIRNFVDYITRLAPEEPYIGLTIDDFSDYSVDGVYATFDKDINQAHETNKATIHWSVKEPQSVNYAHIYFTDSPSEDVKEYRVSFQAGSYSRSYIVSAKDMDRNETLSNGIRITNRVARVSIPIDLDGWFSNIGSNLIFNLNVSAIDKRNNSSTARERVFYPTGKGFPQGYSTFQVFYRPTESRAWQHTFGYSGDSFLGPERRSHGPVGLIDVDGNHRFKVRGYDPGTGWGDWAESPDYNLTFRGDPPGKPNPMEQERTVNSIRFKWKATPNTDYYTVYYRERNKELSKTWTLRPSGNELDYAFFNLTENEGFTIYVRSHNKWYPNGILGTVWLRTRKRVNKTKTYYPTRHVRYNEQSWQPNSTAGYYRPRWDGGIRNAWGIDRPHWERTLSRTSGTMVQGHWRETNWRLGKKSEQYYVARSGGSYRAADGQSHGNNATFVEMNYRQIRNDLKNATVNKVTISLKRAGSIHGWPGKGRPVYLYNHNSDFTGTGPRPSNHLAVYDWYRKRVDRSNNPALASNNFARGGYADIENWKTKSLLINIQKGSMKGFAFIRYYSNWFHNTVHRGATDYIRFDANSFKVTVHYTDIV